VQHKYPFVSADILASSKTIAQALVEGGYDEKPEEGDEDEVEATKDTSASVIRYEESNENKLVQQILQGSQAAQKDLEGKEKETVVEELNLKEDKEENAASVLTNEPEGEDAEKTKEDEPAKDESENVDDSADTPEEKKEEEVVVAVTEDKALAEAAAEEQSKYDFSLLD